jgi:hypothetical protein
MIISISVTADDSNDMKQKLDIALFKLGKHLDQIAALKVDEKIELDKTLVFRSE